MTRRDILNQLADIQAKLCQLVEDVDDADCRQLYHPDLSPLGWHLGHCAFVERYWLREVVLDDDRLTADLHTTYFPALAPPKAKRGTRLPERRDLLAWARGIQSETRSLLDELAPETHALLRQDYLHRFLLQHGCQHYETMQMVLNQRAMQNPSPGYRARHRLAVAPPSAHSRPVPAGKYVIGTRRDPGAYDNELPAHEVVLDHFRIAESPVSNAAFLSFMLEGGYHDRRWWDGEGWAWRSQARASRPVHWRQDDAGAWYAVAPFGPADLEPAGAVMGLSHYEARAYAAWASAQLGTTARLPHEYQWEAGCRKGYFGGLGQVWEWCANTLQPYAGFQAFPYDGYSTPWFDGGHYVLRGGSRHTRTPIRRAGFRNFYQPDKRHIFAGLRLAFDDS